MKPSLEDERRALLAQIEASRAVYRRMLTGGTSGHGAGATASGVTRTGAITGTAPGNHLSAGQNLSGGIGIRAQGFPRSRTVQWVMDHPLMVAAGVALLVWGAPRVWNKRQQSKAAAAQSERAARQDRAIREAHASPREGTVRALLTAAALLMRNPATMRTMARFGASAWQWLQQRRQHRADSAISRIVH